MKNILKALPLPVKLAGVGILPILVLVYFSILILEEKNSRIEIISKYQERLQLSSELIDLANALQSERRVSFSNSIYYASRDELFSSRNNTNEKLEALRKLSLDSTYDVITFTGLNEINSIRDKIDSNLLQPAEIMNYYSNSMLRLNSLAEIKAEHVPFLEPIMGELSGTLLLAEMVTYLGIIRGNIYMTMYVNDKAEQEKTIPALYSLFKMYTYLESEYLVKSPPENVEAYQELINKGNFRETIRNIGLIINSGKFELNISPEEWKDISSKGVDELSALQQKFHYQLQQSVDGIINREVASRNNTLAFIIILIIIVIALLYFTIQNITSSLKLLSSKASTIALGEVNIDIPRYPNDALGSLAESIKKIDLSNQQLSFAAAEIGKGNFETSIPARSDKDELAISLRHMRENLVKFAAENEHTLWLQKGKALVNDSLKGDQEMRKLSEGVLKVLAEYLEADLGVMFITRNGFLRCTAAYAIDEKKIIDTEIPIGQSLTGQVAETGRPLLVQDVPEHYFRISSGLGSAAPKTLYIIPLVYNNHVEGVIELAALSEMHEKTIELLQLVSPDIAIAVLSEKNREKLQSLLEETQTQAEELQAQHSELENLNQALEQQADRLQVSEEELKVQQEELMQANIELEERSRELEELNQMIMERNREIQDQAIQLEKASQYKSEFLANMSHELRTPLNSILLLSRLLAENHNGNLTEEQIDHARVIKNSGEGLLSMIDEILDLTKIEAGKMRLEAEEFPLNSLLSDIRALFNPLASQKNLDFTIEAEENIPLKLFSDKSRIEQILRNLLSNAFKFTREGYVKFSIKNSGEKFISFKVSDSGIGIPPEKQNIIFEAFQQADGSTRRNYGGSGLGLSISRQLAQLLNGTIEVTSIPGKGSEFTLTIPVSIQKGSSRFAQNEPVEAIYSGRDKSAGPLIDYTPFVLKEVPKGIPDDRNNLGEDDKTILIVEDDMNFAKSLLTYTHQRGFKGIVVPRGDDAYHSAKKLKPVAILLDVQLPVKSGWEVLEELQKDPETRRIPVHIMSSFEVKNESLGMGASNFIRKEEALEKIRELFAELENGDPRTAGKIIIIEDNSMHAKALQFFLNEYGIPAAIASTYPEVLNLMTGDAFHHIIIDTGIHAENTYEIVEKIKLQAGFENTPVIIVTNSQISRADELRIKKIARSIVIKTAHSFERVLDELSIFLQVLEESQDKRSSGRKEFNNTLTEILGNKKVLVVDDDVRNIFALTKALEQHKMDVYKAIDGKEALEVLEEHPGIEIVLLDIMMPVMDGFETLEHIRKNPKLKKLPVIAVTAKAMAGDRDACIKAGASDYISKPIDTDQLLSLLRVWLYHG